jgi:SAM-dependent methyltransferase
MDSSAPQAEGLLVKRADVEILSECVGYQFEEEWLEEGNEDNFWMQWRLRSFLSQLKSLKVDREKPLKVLDIGCGFGVLRRQLEAHTKWIIDGADIDARSLSQCQAGQGRIFYYDIRDRHKDLLEAYDAVIAFDIVEHIDAPKPFLEAAVHHVRPGGWLLVNVPALQSFFSAYDEAVGHLRRYNKRSLQTEFAELPVAVQDLRYWGLTMLPLLAMRRIVVGRNLAASSDAQAIVRKGWKASPVLAHMLKAVMLLETAIMPKAFLGTSLLCACQKQL